MSHSISDRGIREKSNANVSEKYNHVFNIYKINQILFKAVSKIKLDNCNL